MPSNITFVYALVYCYGSEQTLMSKAMCKLYVNQRQNKTHQFSAPRETTQNILVVFEGQAAFTLFVSSLGSHGSVRGLFYFSVYFSIFVFYRKER